MAAARPIEAASIRVMSFTGGQAVAARLEAGRLGVASMASWPARRWLVALATAVLAALAIGVPTGVVPTSFYTRMTPVTWWDYPVWAVSAVLMGLVAATYVRAGGAGGGPERRGRTLGAGVVSTFAVGCPVCNKLIVAAIGTSGALTYWAPLQPVLGVASIAVLTAALAIRLRADTACRAPVR